jgi:hypothetical protein
MTSPNPEREQKLEKVLADSAKSGPLSFLFDLVGGRGKGRGKGTAGRGKGTALDLLVGFAAC